MGHEPAGSSTTDAFCNAKAGELIISHAQADAAAVDMINALRQSRIEHVEYVESMQDRLTRWDLNIDESFEYQLHRIRVPAGQEVWKSNYLNYFYRQLLLERLREPNLPLAFAAALGRSDLHLIIQPNHLLKTGAAPAQSTLSRGAFRFSASHEQYKSMLGVRAAASAAPVDIAVLDTGIDAQLGRPARQFNFLNNDRKTTADDDNGHGTVMCSIIQDVAPFARLHVFKVVDREGVATEWDVLAALCALGPARIVNISLGFGLQDVKCSECGRTSNLSRALTYSHASRSMVFENLIGYAIGAGRLVVGAAGNSGIAELDYPARFDAVLAASSMTSKGNRSSFSNYGTLNASGRPHENRFALPGGETREPKEFVGSFGTDTTHGAGTSHAAAYLTGVIAHLWQRAKPENRNYDSLVPAIRANADKNFPAYNLNYHGNGIPRLA